MADTDILIRAAREADAGTLVRFNVAMAQETEGKSLDPVVVDRGVRRLIARPELGFYLVAEQDQRIGGSLMVTSEWSDWRDGLFWWVQSVYVEPELRRRGLYRCLYGAVRRMAADRGDICGIRLYVEKDNLAAQATYQRLGMTDAHYLVYEETLSAGRLTR